MVVETPTTRQKPDILELSAQRVQSAWRRHVSRPKVGNLPVHQENSESSSNINTQWDAAIAYTDTHLALRNAEDGKNEPRARWKRTVHLVSRLHNGSETTTTSKIQQKAEMELKVLETQHWLELTDSKHRYGSNLKYYHRRWLESDTKDNFFKWLDRGDGKALSLDECSREQLESERIVYLTAEQRRNYLVQIDSKGLLRWARNEELVDTTYGMWEDAGDGKGIFKIEASSTPPPIARRHSFASRDSDDGADNHYISAQKKSSSRLGMFIREHLTVEGLTDRLLRKTVRKNTWIYVADKHMNIYVGIKNTGAFQHSSFISGAHVVSAGLLTVHNGLIHKLSPLSGHYRTKINSFRAFIDALEDQGADLHKFKLTRAEMALWGVEKYNRIKKGPRPSIHKPSLTGIENHIKNWTDSAIEGASWKSDVLHGRRTRSTPAPATEEKES